MHAMNYKQHTQRSRQTGFLGLCMLFLLLMLIAIPVGLLVSMSDSNALVVKSAQVDTNSAANAERIAKKLYRGLGRSIGGLPAHISLSERDINSVVGLVVRGIDGLKGRVTVTQTGVKADFTLHFPANPFGEYINLTATLAPSSDGLQVDNLAIGDLHLPGQWFVALIETVLNQMLEEEALGTELREAIESLTVNNSTVTMVYHGIPNFRHKLVKLKGQVSYTQDNAELVAVYYQKLCRFHQQTGRVKTSSLSTYLRDSFAFAQTRSLESNDASEENRAALLALAIFLGSERFNSVIGALDDRTLNACQPGAGRIGLANRDDLRLHFIFSATLKILSSSGLSFSVGEFKELLDSRQGSSGFSFADLAADRAGIRFAELAVHESGAVQLQDMAQQLAREEVFFPAIAGLPEGIHQQEFERLGGIDSNYYKKYLTIIEQRIDKLALYH